MGCRQYVGGGPVILLQLDDPSPLKVLFKIQDIFNIRTPPLVNALIVIPHYADILMGFRQQIDKPVLHVVGVLVFVYHDVPESLLILRQYRFLPFKQQDGVPDQVVEVHGVVLLQDCFIGSVQLPHSPLLGVVLVQFQKFFGRHGLFLAITDDGQDIGGGEHLFVHVPFLDAALDHGFLIRGVVHHKIRGIAQQMSVFPQYSQTGRMESQNPHIQVGSH